MTGAAAASGLLLVPAFSPGFGSSLAWVGLVPFRMAGIAPRGLGKIPYLGTFPETNVRTYVVGPDGVPGVWFDSLDASRLLPPPSVTRIPVQLND